MIIYNIIYDHIFYMIRKVSSFIHIMYIIYCTQNARMNISYPDTFLFDKNCSHGNSK